jgi:outer membrane receptor protein involved in Fe transport
MNFHPSARQQTRRVLFGPKRTFALLFCTSLTAVPAFAQQENGGGSEQLVEIVVTAQRREQNLQDTPVAVSAFGGQELQSRGVSSVQELGRGKNTWLTRTRSRGAHCGEPSPSVLPGPIGSPQPARDSSIATHWH